MMRQGGGGGGGLRSTARNPHPSKRDPNLKSGLVKHKEEEHDLSGASGGGRGYDKDDGSFGRWGVVRGSLVPFLLRKLVRERWDATYGPSALQPPTTTSSSGGGSNATHETATATPPSTTATPAAVLPKYGYWVDGKACGETWVYGCPLHLRRDPSLFTVKYIKEAPLVHTFVRVMGDLCKAEDTCFQQCPTSSGFEVHEADTFCGALSTARVEKIVLQLWSMLLFF
jgi:hypothetical protein